MSSNIKKNFAFIKSKLQLIIAVILYYSFSIALTFYQKWIIKDFHYPLSMVFIHLVIKFIFAGCFRLCYFCWFKETRVSVKCKDSVSKISVIGITSGLDIGLSNWSFEYITISLYTMCKSTSIVFIMFFSILLGLEKKQWSMIIVIFQIAVGLFFFTFESVQFHWEGFILVLLASFLSGIRWTFAQLVMQREQLGLSNPMDMMYYVQPWMMISILPLLFYFEGQRLTQALLSEHISFISVSMFALCVVSIGGLLAFLLELTEYWALVISSSLTLVIAAIIKEICVLTLAVYLNGDRMKPLNIIGLILCMSGIILHMTRNLLNEKRIYILNQQETNISQTPLLSPMSDSNEEIEKCEKSTM